MLCEKKSIYYHHGNAQSELNSFCEERKSAEWFVMDKKLFQMGRLRNLAPYATSFLVSYDINKRIEDL